MKLWFKSYKLITNWSLKWSRKIKISDLGQVRTTSTCHADRDYRVVQIKNETMAKKKAIRWNRNICWHILATLHRRFWLSPVERRDGRFRDRGARNSARMIGKVGACVRDSRKNSFPVCPFILLFCARLISFVVFVTEIQRFDLNRCRLDILE